MARVNKSTRKPRTSGRTHEGAPAAPQNAEQLLRRSVLACLLWEKGFYEDGQEIADRIATQVRAVSPETAKQIAIEARTQQNLRHVPLLVVREMARNAKQRSLVSDTLTQIIQRPDELTEFVAMYWKDKKQPLANQVKRGLRKAFTKFDAYQLQKYNRDTPIKLRDVMFMVHPTPQNDAQAKTWKQLAEKTLSAPDTWEVGLSSGKDKKETFTRLMEEKKLGAMAYLRNLRGMQTAGVTKTAIRKYAKDLNVSRVLPFRFIAAAKYAPDFEPDLEKLMFKSLEDKPRLEGSTAILVDVSGSMDYKLSQKSDMDRIDAACGVALIVREVCDDVDVFSFSAGTKKIPPRRGFALRDGIKNSQPHSSTYLGAAVNELNTGAYDQIIVITDEQSHDRVPAPRTTNPSFMINVASYKPSVNYGQWVGITGWSDAIVDYIVEYQKMGFRD